MDILDAGGESRGRGSELKVTDRQFSQSCRDRSVSIGHGDFQSVDRITEKSIKFQPGSQSNPQSNLIGDAVKRFLFRRRYIPVLDQIRLTI